MNSTRRARRQTLPRIVVAGASPELVDALEATRLHIQALPSAGRLIAICPEVSRASCDKHEHEYKVSHLSLPSMETVLREADWRN